MIEKIEGFLISETPYGDTSKIINILTPTHGIVGIMCKGAKSMKSKLRSTTTRFTYGIFNVYYKENKLSILISVDIINDLRNFQTDITLMGYLTYLTDLVTQVFKQNNDSDIYKLFINSILKINDGKNPMILTNILEIKLLEYLGIGLNLDSCNVCGKTTDIATINADIGGYVCKSCLKNERIVDVKAIKMLRMYYYVEISSITDIDISDLVAHEINSFLNLYYDRYTGLYLKSKDFLNKVR